MATENPAFAGGPDEDAGSSMGIKAGLKDGTLTSDEAIVLMEEQMEAREKQLRAEMRAEIAAARLGAAGVLWWFSLLAGVPVAKQQSQNGPRGDVRVRVLKGNRTCVA